jgi:hypothetical protein
MSSFFLMASPLAFCSACSRGRGRRGAGGRGRSAGGAGGPGCARGQLLGSRWAGAALRRAAAQPQARPRGRAPRRRRPRPAAWPPGTAPAPRRCAAAAPAAGGARVSGRRRRPCDEPRPAVGPRRQRGRPAAAPEPRQSRARAAPLGAAPPEPRTSLQMRLSFLGLILMLRWRHMPASGLAPWRTRLGAAGSVAVGRSGTISSGDMVTTGAPCLACCSAALVCSGWRACGDAARGRVRAGCCAAVLRRAGRRGGAQGGRRGALRGAPPAWPPIDATRRRLRGDEGEARGGGASAPGGGRGGGDGPAAQLPPARPRSACCIALPPAAAAAAPAGPPCASRWYSAVANHRSCGRGAMLLARPGGGGAVRCAGTGTASTPRGERVSLSRGGDVAGEVMSWMMGGRARRRCGG